MPSLSKSIPVVLLVGVSGVLAAPAVTGNQEKNPCIPACTAYDGSQRYDLCHQASDPMNPDYCPANMQVEDYGRLLDHCKKGMTGQKDNCEFNACKWLDSTHKTWGDASHGDSWGSPSKPSGDKSWGSPSKPSDGGDKSWKPAHDNDSWGSSKPSHDDSWSPSKPSHGDDKSWNDDSWGSPSKPSHDDDSWGSSPSKPSHGGDKSWSDDSWSPSKPAHGNDNSWPVDTPPKPSHNDWWQNQNDHPHDAWTPESDHHEPAGEKDCGCDEDEIKPPHVVPLPIDPKTPIIPKTPIDPKTPVDPKTPINPKAPIDPKTPINPKAPIDPKGTPKRR